MWELDMGKICVLLANEPRVYREAMATAFRRLRPGAEIIVAEADELDEQIRDLRPHLVMSSQAARCLEDHPLSHVLLYSEGESKALVSLDGQQTAILDVELDDLLLVIDRVQDVLKMS